MKQILTILLTLLCLSGWAQVTFDKGYIIDNDGKKTECLIENKEWAYNPATIQYKLSENDQPVQASVGDVKEFEIYSYSKFISALVEIDTSNSAVLSQFSTSRNPEWTKRTLFLKVVVEGKANLYHYQTSKLSKFFFTSPSNASIRQLVFKEYFKSPSVVGENIMFRQQLSNEVNCGTFSKVYFERIVYKMSDLKRHFMKYNICMGDVAVAPKPENQNASGLTRDALILKVTPGVNYTSLNIENDASVSQNVTFDGKVAFRVGLEIEYIFPFNKNKWSVFAEPTYQAYSSTKIYNTTSKATVTYNAVELPIGVRHYFFLKGDSKIFLNAFILPGFVQKLSGSTVAYGSTVTTPTSDYNIKPATSAGIGGGYGKGPLSLELRYYTAVNLLSGYVSLNTSYQRVAFIVGYRFLTIRKKG